MYSILTFCQNFGLERWWQYKEGALQSLVAFQYSPQVLRENLWQIQREFITIMGAYMTNSGSIYDKFCERMREHEGR